MRTNQAIYDKAVKVIPGGVNSPVRAFQSVGMTPLFIEKGKGAKVYDVEGHTYLDYIGSWGPLILGHSHPVVNAGIMEAIEQGTSYGLPTEGEVALAELIIEAYPSMDMVRMVNSGTEATMSAIRVARGYTGRNKILKFEGCYHGHGDSLLVQSGSGALTFGVPTSAGVPQKVVEDTVVSTFNDSERLKQVFKANEGELAAVIVEVVPGNMGVIPPDPDFLKLLRELTKASGTVLIFDEVITGFRLAYGGAQEVYGIEPDMTCLGKIIGGGLPVGAYGGKKAIMEKVAPLGNVYQAGTLSGNPIAVKMGYNTLSYLKEHQDIYAYIEGLAIQLQEGFEQNVRETGIKATVNRVKSMLTLFFHSGPVRSYETATQSDTQCYGKYFKGMLEKGILLPPSQFEGMFLSIAHTEEDIKRTIEVQKEVFKTLVE